LYSSGDTRLSSNQDVVFEWRYTVVFESGCCIGVEMHVFPRTVSMS
jgi:hypothetical protein